MLLTPPEVVELPVDTGDATPMRGRPTAVYQALTAEKPRGPAHAADRCLSPSGAPIAAQRRVVGIQVLVLVAERKQVHAALLDPADRRSLLRSTRSS